MVRRGLLLAIIILIADQASKFWLLSFFAGAARGERVWPVTGFFNLVLTWNRGISFGVFNDANGYDALVFAVVAAIIVAGLLWWLTRVTDGWIAAAIGLIIGGAVGNAFDRVYRGAVVDFLDFHLQEWHWFAFNVADAAISIGVVLLILDMFRGRRGVS